MEAKRGTTGGQMGASRAFSGHQKVLRMALGTADARETSLKPSTGQEILKRSAPRPAAGTRNVVRSVPRTRAHSCRKGPETAGRKRFSPGVWHDTPRAGPQRADRPAARRNRRIQLPMPVPRPAQNKRGMPWRAIDLPRPHAAIGLTVRQPFEPGFRRFPWPLSTAPVLIAAFGQREEAAPWLSIKASAQFLTCPVELPVPEFVK